MADTRPTPRRSMRPRRSLAVTADQLNLAELRAYARQIGGPDSYDRAALIDYCAAHHVHNSNRPDNNDPAHNHNAGTDRVLGQR